MIIQLLYYLLILFTPLIMFSRTSELFEFNKTLFIYLITILVAFFWILKMVVSKKIILKKTVFDIPILTFLLSQILATIFSIDGHTSFFGYYGRFNGGLLSIISYVVLFYGFVSNFQPKTVTKFLKLSLFSSFTVILWGLPGKMGYDLSCLVFTGAFNNSCWTEQFHPESRMFSTLGQPNWLGAYLAVNFFIGLYFLFKSWQNTKYFILSTLYLLLNFTAILFTRSRSALLSVIVGSAIFFFYIFFTKRRQNIKQLLILFLLLLIPILVFKTGIEKIDSFLKLPNKLPISGNQSPITASGVTESFDIRKIVWKGAIDLGLKYPLFGTGVETFAYSYYFVRPAAHNLTSEWDYLYNKAHNEYLNYLATTGFLGLGTYLIFLGSVIFFGIIKSHSGDLPAGEDLRIELSRRSEAKEDSGQARVTDNTLLIICLLLAYLSILITNFFGFSITSVNLFFYLIPAAVVVWISEKTKRTEVHPVTKLTTGQWLSAACLFFLTSLAVIYLVRYFLADVSYAAADNYLKIGDYQLSVRLLEKAIQYRDEHVYEDKLSYVLANLAFIASYQKQTKLAGELIQLSDYYNQKSLTASPKNVLYFKTKAKNEFLFYQITGNREEINKGIKVLEESKKLSPTDPKIFYSLGVFYSILYDNTKNITEKEQYQSLSLAEIDSSIKLKSNFRDGYLLKGQLLKKYGDLTGSKKAYQNILDKINPQDAEAKKEITTF